MTAVVTTPLAGPASLRTRLTQGVIWNLVSAVTVQGSTFVVNVLQANILGRVTFGKYAVVINSVLAVSLAAQLAAGYTAAKYLAELRASDKARAGRILGLAEVLTLVSALVCSVGLGLLARLIAVRSFHAPDLTMPVLISSVFLFFSVVNGFQIGALQGLEGFNSLARASIASGAAAVVIAPAAGYLWGVTGAVAGLAVAGAIRWVLLHFSLAGELRKAGIVLCRRGLRREFDTLFRFALPAALAGFSIGPAAWICNTILVRVPKGFSQAAVYSASLSMLTILLFLPQVVDRVVMVLLNHQKGLNDGSSYRKVFFTNVGVISAVTVGGAACLALAGPYLLRLFGKSFASDGYPVLVILLLAGIPEALTLAVSQILISKERFWLFTLGAVLPRDCALVGGAMILTPRYGALGLAAAYAVARLAGLLLSLAFALRTGLSLDGGKSSPA